MPPPGPTAGGAAGFGRLPASGQGSASRGRRAGLGLGAPIGPANSAGIPGGGAASSAGVSGGGAGIPAGSGNSAGISGGPGNPAGIPGGPGNPAGVSGVGAGIPAAPGNPAGPGTPGNPGAAGAPERTGVVPAGTPDGPRPSAAQQGAQPPLTGLPRAGGKPAEDEEHRVADYLEPDPELFAAEQPVVPPTLGDWKKNKNWRTKP